MSNIPIRIISFNGSDLSSENIDKFVDVVYKCYGDISAYPELKHTRYEINRVCVSNNAIITIAMIGNHMVGYIISEVIMYANTRIMHIYYLYTSSLHRGLGIGTYLLNNIYAYAHQLNVLMLSLTFDTENKKLESFYFHNGFRYASNTVPHKKYDALIKYITYDNDNNRNND